MKLNREQITELFGSAPDEQEGKKLLGVSNEPPLQGQIFYFNGVWNISRYTHSLTSRPVAIFQDTNRKDGTPMEIAELPVVEGYRFKYAGFIKDDEKLASEYLAYYPKSGKWSSVHSFVHCGFDHYALAYKIAKPTKLEDLVGKDGQKNFYIIHEDIVVEQCFIGSSHIGLLFLQSTCEAFSFEIAKDKKLRWSNSPFTAYEDAQEFIVAGGDNE